MKVGFLVVAAGIGVAAVGLVVGARDKRRERLDATSILGRTKQATKDVASGVGRVVGWLLGGGNPVRDTVLHKQPTFKDAGLKPVGRIFDWKIVRPLETPPEEPVVIVGGPLGPVPTIFIPKGG